MIKSYILLSLLLTGFFLQAQTPYVKNAVYLELLGNGGLYSFNYERAFSPNFNARIGFGSWWGTGIFFF